MFYGEILTTSIQARKIYNHPSTFSHLGEAAFGWRGEQRSGITSRTTCTLHCISLWFPRHGGENSTWHVHRLPCHVRQREVCAILTRWGFFLSPNLRNADQSIVQIPFIFSFACHPFKIRDIAKHYELGLMNNETWLRWITAVLGSSSLSP